MPPGLSDNFVTGHISGTPTQAGVYAVTIEAQTPVGLAEDTLNLTVYKGVIALTSPTTATAEIGQPFTCQTAFATSEIVTYSANLLPMGLQFDPVSGVLSGTPTQTGIFHITLTGTTTDAAGGGTLNLTINLDTPVVSSPSSVSATLGVPFSFQVAASNQPNDFEADHLPPGLKINASTGLISGTPLTAGTYVVDLDVGNNDDDSESKLTITVSGTSTTVALVATTTAITAGSGPVGALAVKIPAALPTNLVVHYPVKGSAVPGTDYVALSGTAKIKAGKTSKTITVTPVGNGGGPGVTRTVVIKLQSAAAYQVGAPQKVKLKIFGQ